MQVKETKRKKKEHTRAYSTRQGSSGSAGPGLGNDVRNTSALRPAPARECPSTVRAAACPPVCPPSHSMGTVHAHASIRFTPLALLTRFGLPENWAGSTGSSSVAGIGAWSTHSSSSRLDPSWLPRQLLRHLYRPRLRRCPSAMGPYRPVCRPHPPRNPTSIRDCRQYPTGGSTTVEKLVL